MFSKALLGFAAAAAIAAASIAGAAETKPMMADKHVAAGLKCESCHGAGDAKVDYPEKDKCAACHDIKKISEKTKGVKPHNPHDSPHYHQDLECTLCHVMHSEPEVYCNQCHKFDFKMP